MRKCYSAPCRFHAEDTTRSNRINWYFVPDGTQIYEGRTVFTPRIDDSDVTNDSLTEPTGTRVAQRRYNSGINRWGTTGLHVDGDEQDFLRQSPRTKFSPDGEPITNPCGLIGADLFCLDLIFRDSLPADPPTPHAYGLALALLDTFFLRNTYYHAYGLKLGIKDYRPITVKAGLLLGLRDSVTLTGPLLDAFGLELGLRSKDHLPIPAVDLFGLNLGLSDEVGSSAGEPDAFGLELGLRSKDHLPIPAVDLLGLKLGLSDALELDNGDVDAFGLELGSTHRIVGNIPLTDASGLQLGLSDEIVYADPDLAPQEGLLLGTSDTPAAQVDAHGLELADVLSDETPLGGSFGLALGLVDEVLGPD